MKTKIGTEVAHVTHDSYTTFKVKRSKANLLLNADVLNSQHTGTGATWRINTKILLCRNSTATWFIHHFLPIICHQNPPATFELFIHSFIRLIQAMRPKRIYNEHTHTHTHTHTQRERETDRQSIWLWLSGAQSNITNYKSESKKRVIFS